MKKTVFLIMTAIFACLNMVMADTVCSIQGDVIVSSSKYIDPFWSDSIPHSSINYVKKSKITLDASDGYYDINFYRPANGEGIEEDLATFGDVFFSKMVIDYAVKVGVLLQLAKYYRVKFTQEIFSWLFPACFMMPFGKRLFRNTGLLG